MNTQAQAPTFEQQQVPLRIAGISLMAVPFCFAQANIEILQGNPTLLLIFGLISLSAVGALAYLTVFRRLSPQVSRSPYLILFSIFAFAAIIDLLISFTVMGYTDVMQSYFDNGEPYLRSSHGMAVNFWDGTVHFGLYLWMIFCLAERREHSREALFWVGSIVGSCIVYMAGNVIGEYAEHIEPSFLLNVPFMLVPIFYGWKVINDDSSQVPTTRSALSLSDFALVAALLTVAGLSCFRMLVVLNSDITMSQTWATEIEPYLLSPTRYPQIQMLVYGLYLMPFSILAAIAFWRPPSRALACWAWIIAGAVAQGQFSHIVASISAASDPEFATAAGQQLTFWFTNLMVMLIPLWFAWRYHQRLQH